MSFTYRGFLSFRPLELVLFLSAHWERKNITSHFHQKKKKKVMKFSSVKMLNEQSKMRQTNKIVI